jgi:hypothetical protein
MRIEWSFCRRLSLVVCQDLLTDPYLLSPIYYRPYRLSTIDPYLPLSTYPELRLCLRRGFNGRTIWIVDAHRFIVHADEKLTAFLELERAICLRLLTDQRNQK